MGQTVALRPRPVPTPLWLPPLTPRPAPPPPQHGMLVYPSDCRHAAGPHSGGDGNDIAVQFFVGPGARAVAGGEVVSCAGGPVELRAAVARPMPSARLRVAVLALMARVIGNVPVYRCAIICALIDAAQHIVATGRTPLLDAELAILAIVRAPVAIRAVAARLGLLRRPRTRVAFLIALQAVYGTVVQIKASDALLASDGRHTKAHIREGYYAQVPGPPVAPGTPTRPHAHTHPPTHPHTRTHPTGFGPTCARSNPPNPCARAQWANVKSALLRKGLPWLVRRLRAMDDAQWTAFMGLRVDDRRDELGFAEGIYRQLGGYATKFESKNEYWAMHADRTVHVSKGGAGWEPPDAPLLAMSSHVKTSNDLLFGPGATLGAAKALMVQAVRGLTAPAEAERLGIALVDGLSLGDLACFACEGGKLRVQADSDGAAAMRAVLNANKQDSWRSEVTFNTKSFRPKSSTGGEHVGWVLTESYGQGPGGAEHADRRPYAERPDRGAFAGPEASLRALVRHVASWGR